MASSVNTRLAFPIFLMWKLDFLTTLLTWGAMISWESNIAPRFRTGSDAMDTSVLATESVLMFSSARCFLRPNRMISVLSLLSFSLFWDIQTLMSHKHLSRFRISRLTIALSLVAFWMISRAGGHQHIHDCSDRRIGLLCQRYDVY